MEQLGTARSVPARSQLLSVSSPDRNEAESLRQTAGPVTDHGQMLAHQRIGRPGYAVVQGASDLLDRGEHELKGVPGTWRLSAVAAHPPGIYT